MVKPKTVYICQSCGAEFPKWQGPCAQCKKWNSLVETVVGVRGSVARRRSRTAGKGLQKLSKIESELRRLKTGIREFDRAWGGGVVPGSIVLLVGEPGIGKSTLLLQVAERISTGSGPVLYICGEESPAQIKLRAQRLGILGEQLSLLAETDVDVICEAVKQLNVQKEGMVKLVIVDSIQTMTTEDLAGGAGSVGQVRECGERLRRVAKGIGVPIVLVGHMTKSGGLAGPKVLEHLVDAVFTLEGDRFHSYRMLRSVKNRFGSCFEVGVFEMGKNGLKEVENPSALFISERGKGVPGSVITATMEGTRSVLVEVQALVTPSEFKYPRRMASGFSLKRLQLLVAVLEKRTGLDLQNQDIYVNVASGFKVREPAADLAVALALASSFLEKPIAPDLCAFGEVGLAGEVRRVRDGARRASEARRLGYSKALDPSTTRTLGEAFSEAGLSKRL